MELSSMLKGIEKSGTVHFTSVIKKLRQKGKEIIDFAVGDPEFMTLSPIIDATKEALSHGKTKYDEVSGILELRAAIAKKYTGYNEDNIIISNGSKQSLFHLFQVLIDPGDEVILIRPHWPTFAQQIKIAGGTPVIVNTKNHQLDFHAIEQAITKKTKAIVINSPNNPTGAIYPFKDLRLLTQLAKTHNFFIISDEAYSSFIYDGLKHHSIFSIDNDVRDRIIIVGSFSKSYYMSGFRIGYLAAEKYIIDSITRLQEHTTGNVCTFAQYGAIAALSIDKNLMSRQRSELWKKRDLACGHAS
ncbi:MAG: aminotransferase class I/II-fold pyridoxal phosphate-dependent enzyme, partial [Desulfobacteraceae bacterium]|nr:aminotransferase class I/II-fold pyridoxal phosphate-dependent enzyme [Desulfobacteraceae bacterium]